MPDTPKHTLLIDTEGGSTSVRDLIRSEFRSELRSDGKWVREEFMRNPEGTVTVEHAPTFKQVEDTFWRIKRGQYEVPPDIVVIDTLTALSTTTRQDVVYTRAGAKSDEDIWGGRSKLASQQQDWGASADYLIRCLRHFRGLPMLTIFLCHERIKTDEVTKEQKGGPDLQPMLLSDVRSFSDDIFRIAALDREFSMDGKKYPRGTRFLRMQTSESYFTKVRTGKQNPVPEQLESPTLQKVRAIMGDFFPLRLTVFGAPGAGKTTFACSMSRID